MGRCDTAPVLEIGHRHVDYADKAPHPLVSNCRFYEDNTRGHMFHPPREPQRNDQAASAGPPRDWAHLAAGD